MKIEVDKLSHRDFHNWNQYQIWKLLYGVLIYGNCVGVSSPVYILNFLQKLFFLMAAAMCHAFIQIKVKIANSFCFQQFSRQMHTSQDYFVSTHISFCSLENCKLHFVSIGTSFSQLLQRLCKFIYIY